MEADDYIENKHLKSMIANLEAEQNYIMALFEGKCELRDNKK